jgi:hypothetical protein
MIYKHIILILVPLFIIMPIQATTTLVGNAQAATNQTFTFPIQAHISSPDGSSYYVAAHPSLGSPLNYAVSRIYLDGTQFVPLTPQLVSLNNSNEGMNDPLYNQNIALLGLLSAVEARGPNRSRIESPTVVLSSDPTSVYVIDTFYQSNGGAVESAIGIKDANGAVTSGIVGLGNMSNVYAVAAAKANTGGNFGAIGSGLAIIQLSSQTSTDGKSSATQRIFSQVGSSALPFDVSSPAVAIQANAASITNNASMYWDENLGRMFVGIQVTAGSAAGDGALSVSILAEPFKLNFVSTPIAAATVFTSGLQEEIIGAINPNAQISANIIKTMLTSTGCSYLIVQGGNGSPSATTQRVYALPLVSGQPQNSTIQGLIADKTQAPNPVPLGNAPSGGFTIPATTPAGMTLSTDLAAQVGGGSLAAGAISDMFVRGDTVYASVFTANAGQLPGTFYSQAIFNANGSIQAWTDWQRVAGSINQNTNQVDQVYGGTLDEFGDFTTITGTGVNALFTVKRTVWGTDDNDNLFGGTQANAANGLVQVISALFPAPNAGVQGCIDFPPATPGLSNISLLVATGLNQVSLVETGSVTAGVLGFNFGDFLTNSVIFSDGAITQNLPVGGATTRVVTISGGALNSIGPVTCAEIAANTLGGANNAWLAVGGVGGLAILTSANGNGWAESSGLGPNFSGLVNGMSFVQVGNYSYVRKLLCDNNFLYVLTDKELNAIDLDASDFGTGTLVASQLATLSSLGLTDNDTLIDYIVSGKFALLATSKGLYRVGDGNNILLADTPYGPGWTPVALPQSIGPATQLFPITTTGRSQDFAIHGGSNIYVLNAYVGSNNAQLARYTVADTSTVAITETTIQEVVNSFPNIANPTVPIQAPLVFYRGFRDLFATDGAVFFNACSRNLQTAPFVNIKIGMLRGSATNDQNIITLPLSISSASHITQIVRDFASGNWLIAGDFGLRVNE